LAIAQDVVGQAPDALPVLLDERLERRHVARATSLDERGVIGVHERSPRDPARHALDAATTTLIHSPAGAAVAQRQQRVEGEHVALRTEAGDLAAGDRRDQPEAAAP